LRDHTGGPGPNPTRRQVIEQARPAVLSRLKQIVTRRVRGQVDVHRLVAQGLRLGQGVYIAPTAYLDAGTFRQVARPKFSPPLLTHSRG
jgi:hypothetical protein